MKVFPVLVCAAVCSAAFVSCGNDDEKRDGSGHMYNASLLGNPKSLDPQFADDESSATVIKNLYSGLFSLDADGNAVPCNAKEYSVSDDGLTYTFKLREDNYWFIDEDGSDTVDEEEYFHVVADDYVFALQRVLDPSMQSPFADCFSCILGGAESLAGSISPEETGVAALDDYTLTVSLAYPCAEFLTFLTTNGALPCNREFFYETKGRYGLDDKSVMSNGAFFVRQWFYDPYGVNNILYMKKNSANACESFTIMPSYLSFSIESSESDIQKLFKDKDINCLTTLSPSYSGKKYSVSSSSATTLGLVFNPDDKIFSNKSLHEALARSIDRESIAGGISSDLSVAYGIIPPAVNVGGRSFRELSSDRTLQVYDTSAAQISYGTAKHELHTESFDGYKILVSTETIDSGYLHLISQQWQDTLGCYIGVEEVTAEEFDRRIAEGEYSIALYPLKSEFNCAFPLIASFDTTVCLRRGRGYAELIDGVRKCSTVGELVEKYSSAESEIIQEYNFIPLFYKKSYLAAGKENDDIIYDPFTGAVDFRIAQNYD